MSGKVIARVIAVLGLVGSIAAPPAMADGVGGVAAPERPQVRAADCGGAKANTCPRGAELRVTGNGLARTRKVMFLGDPGRGDDRQATPVERADDALSVMVPAGAHSGPVQLTTDTGDRVSAVRRMVIRGRVAKVADQGAALPAGKAFLDGAPVTFRYTLAAAAAAAAPAARVELYRVGEPAGLRSWPADGSPVSWDATLAGRPVATGHYGFRVVGAQTTSVSAAAGPTAEFELLDHVFPIRGEHDLGQGAVNGFGGGRGHQGQDMFAACGTPLVAARGGTVQRATHQSRAGNYLVIGEDSGESAVYMHMSKPALVKAGQRVRTGQPIGVVGQTGRASGCHLHFELWTAPGWYAGGKPVDTLGLLTAWDAVT